VAPKPRQSPSFQHGRALPQVLTSDFEASPAAMLAWPKPLVTSIFTFTDATGPDS